MFGQRRSTNTNTIKSYTSMNSLHLFVFYKWLGEAFNMYTSMFIVQFLRGYYFYMCRSDFGWTLIHAHYYGFTFCQKTLITTVTFTIP